MVRPVRKLRCGCSLRLRLARLPTFCPHSLKEEAGMSRHDVRPDAGLPRGQRAEADADEGKLVAAKVLRNPNLEDVNGT
ncbi:hypothetical protein GCM10023174_07900 [Chelativorans composti]